ncbi:MAG: glycosyltransferase, partial [bacterium]|nr:glycosyltransferase [bacterium]
FKPESAVFAGDYYLAVGRFLPYKKFDIAIEAFNKLKISLKIIGFGPDLKRLKKMAGPTVEILDWVSDDGVLASYYQKARAFIFPQEEDFGISAVEAMAAGRPVIAFRAGGALEIVKEGETGLFFNEQTPAALKEAVLKFQKMNFDSQKIINWVKQFDKEGFKLKIKNFVEKSYEDFKNS